MADSGREPPNGGGETGPTAVPSGSLWARSLARHLVTPIFVVDAEGNLVYFNLAAEPLLGRRCAEVGPLPAPEWSALWWHTNLDGMPITLERLPIMVALRERTPVHGWLYLLALDGVRRWIEVTAFPLARPDGGVLGAAALFWEPEPHR